MLEVYSPCAYFSTRTNSLGTVYVYTTSEAKYLGCITKDDEGKHNTFDKHGKRLKTTPVITLHAAIKRLRP